MANKPMTASTSTGGTKYDQDKPRLDLVPSEAIEEIAQVLAFGANKYGAHNWRGGIVLSRLLAACLRHVFARLRGEVYDPESGLRHLAHAGCCILFALNTEIIHKTKFDDLYKETA